MLLLFDAIVGFVRETLGVRFWHHGFLMEALFRAGSSWESVPLIHAANYSVGVAVLRRAVAMAAEALDGWDTQLWNAPQQKG